MKFLKTVILSAFIILMLSCANKNTSKVIVHENIPEKNYSHEFIPMVYDMEYYKDAIIQY